MLPYSDYKKSRLIFETYFLINSGQATTKKELSDLLGTNGENIENYIKELNSEFETDIYYDKKNKKYIVEQEGIMGLLKRNYPITADDVLLILASLVQSQTFIDTKMTIIQNSLLGLLPKEDSEKLKDMFNFKKKENYSEQNIEFNITNIRKAITTEKKITFIYKNSEGNIKNYKMTPYSFAYELGKYYLIGNCEGKEYLFHLRLDRMGNVKILDEEGKREEKFNVYDYLRKTWYMYGGIETKVVVRFKDRCKKVVTERNMTEGRIIKEYENYFDYEFICNGTKGIKLWIMGFGGDAEVLEPKEFREETKESVKSMGKIYF